MAVTMIKYEAPHGSPSLMLGERTCDQLQPGEESEALRFLAERPIHTVFIATLMRDNGAVSPNNRGTFYVCRNRAKKIEGIALIGHATIVEARTDHAVAAFAQLAARSQHAYLIRGERRTVETFWQHYSEGGQPARLVCREMLFEKTEPTPPFEPVAELRLATLQETEQVVAINALLASEDGGRNPLERDPEGFRTRMQRRIDQQRIWIWMRDGKAIFKADIVGKTPEMIYLEGIHIHPDERKKGYGRRCLLQLSSILARPGRSVCLTINERRANAAAFYVRAGFDYHSEYETIYLGKE
ncbi:MAG: GNAT family N-acetyltransferase [Pyrinomonadaceae bacterium]